MENLNKTWLEDYPPEIRLLVYDHFFSLMNIGIHAIDGLERHDPDKAAARTCPLLLLEQPPLPPSSSTSTDNKDTEMDLEKETHTKTDTKPWWQYRRQKALNLLLTCKAINAEATPLFYRSCRFETVDCHCWYYGKARLPDFARQRIRNIVCPVLSQSGCLTTLGKVFRKSGESGPKYPKILTLVPVMFAEGPEGLNQSGKRMLDHLQLVLFTTRYELKQLECWFVDRDRRLCHMLIDSKHNARVSVPFALGADTDLLLQEFRTKCRIVNKVVFVTEDRVKIVHEFMTVSKRHDCWLQMREFQNVQR